VVTGLGVLALLWLGAAWWNTANLAPGSSISGVAVGGMSLSEARQAVATQTQDVLDDPVTVTVNGSSAQITPSKAGVSVDAEASVERLTRFTLNPATIFNRFTGARVDAVVNVDPVALTGALGSHLDELATGTANASVILNGTTPVLIPASAGNGVDIAASVRRLTANWPLGKTTIELDAGQARPTITDAAAQAFINDTLNPLLSAPLTITAAGTDAASISAGDVTLSPEQVAGLVTISSSGTALSAALDADMLYDTVVSTMGGRRIQTGHLRRCLPPSPFSPRSCDCRLAAPGAHGAGHRPMNNLLGPISAARCFPSCSRSPRPRAGRPRTGNRLPRAGEPEKVAPAYF